MGFRASARPSRGRTRTPFAEVARRHDAWILVGSTAETSGDPDRPYNTSALIAPDGSIAARYRKVHLFDVAVEAGPVDTESARVTAGDRLVTASVDGATVGLSICYDLRFPELYRGARAGRRDDPDRPGQLHGAHRSRPLGGPASRAGDRERRVRPRAVADRRTARPAGVRPFDGRRSVGHDRGPGTGFVAIVRADLDLDRVALSVARSRSLRTAARTRTRRASSPRIPSRRSAADMTKSRDLRRGSPLSETPSETTGQRMSWTPTASPLLRFPLPTGPDVTYRTNQPARQLELPLPPTMLTMLVPYVGRCRQRTGRVVPVVRVGQVVEVERRDPDDVVEGVRAAADRLALSVADRDHHDAALELGVLDRLFDLLGAVVAVVGRDVDREVVELDRRRDR